MTTVENNPSTDNPAEAETPPFALYPEDGSTPGSHATWDANPETPWDYEETEKLGDRIAELSARIQAATYHLLVMIREFDQRHGWADGGFKTCAH